MKWGCEDVSRIDTSVNTDDQDELTDSFFQYGGRGFFKKKICFSFPDIHPCNFMVLCGKSEEETNLFPIN